MAPLVSMGRIPIISEIRVFQEGLNAMDRELVVFLAVGGPEVKASPVLSSSSAIKS
jgi:hypothetical protein